MREHSRIIGASILALLALTDVLSSQGAAPSSPLVVLSRDGREPLPTTVIGGQEMIDLETLRGPFNLTIRDDNRTDSLRVSYRDQSILLTPGNALVSVEGRLVSLPAPLTRIDGRAFVPVEFLSGALGLIYEQPIDLRKGSRLLIVGPLSVPRVRLQYGSVDGNLRVTLDIAPTTGYDIEQQPGRLLVRFDADALDVTLPPLPGTSDLLAATRLVGPTTLEMTLGRRFGSHGSSVVSATAASSRVLVDLLAAMPTVADPMPAPAPDPPFLLSAPRPVISTIVIDPGHGGDDAGALGATGGLMEKDVALAVAERLERAIETRFGISVLQTRTDDRRVGPDERAAYANNAKGDLFISLHVNAAPQPTLQGASVLYLELDRYGDEVRRQAHLASGALPVFGGGSRAIDLVQWDMAQAQHVDGSAVLASLVERELRTRVVMSPEAVRQGPMRVLVGVNMPAVLIEMGYLTNPDDEAALASSAYQTRLVEAITEAIAAFRVYLEQLGEFEAR